MRRGLVVGAGNPGFVPVCGRRRGSWVEMISGSGRDEDLEAGLYTLDPPGRSFDPQSDRRLGGRRV